MKHHYFTPRKCALFFCIISLFSPIPKSHSATTTFDDVYQITDLGNRGLDVILRKSKGVKPPVLPRWSEKKLGRYHVYQLQVACLDEIRRMETKFKMTPYPHVIVSPGPLSEKNLYKLSTVILSEVRRIAIHLNIWGLPKQKRAFSGETPTSIFEETLTLYLKLRVLGGRRLPSASETAAEFGRTVADVKILLNKVDPARRYQDIFPATTQQDVGQSYGQCLNVRRELNGVRTFYKMSQTSLPKPQTKPTITDLFTQSQIILGELNQIKTTTQALLPAPPVAEPTTKSIAQQLNTLHKLTAQIKPLANLNKQEGK